VDIYFGSDADVSLAGLLGLLEHRDVSHVATLGSDAFFFIEELYFIEDRPRDHVSTDMKKFSSGVSILFVQFDIRSRFPKGIVLA